MITPDFRAMTIARLAALVGLVAALAVVGYGCRGSVGAGQPEPAARSGPPNIVLILTDDQDAASIVYMPRLQSLLVQQGLSFANAFVTYPLCCPSRVSILTGQYPHNHRNLWNAPPLGGFKKFYDEGREASTIATWLQAAGYRTGLFGKYLNNYPANRANYVAPGWDAWVAVVESPELRRYYNYRLVEDGHPVFYGDSPEEYETDVLADKVIAFIERAEADDDRPFFVYFSPPAPHSDRTDNGPPTVAPRHLRAFADLSVPQTPAFNEADMSDKPRAWQQLPPLPLGTSYLDHFYRSRLRSLLAVDDAIERIVSTLAERGDLANTYIVFTSDNGYHMGQHRLVPDKNLPIEEDIRVPLIVRGPGVPSGTSLPHLVLNIDLAPTFAELADAVAADFVDGRSAAPLLTATPPPPDTWRQDFLFTVYRSGQAGTQPILGLRTRDDFYVEYSTGERGLYDMRHDPDQLESLHAVADPALLAQLAARVSELQSCAAETCRR